MIGLPNQIIDFTSSLPSYHRICDSILIVTYKGHFPNCTLWAVEAECLCTHGNQYGCKALIVYSLQLSTKTKCSFHSKDGAPYMDQYLLYFKFPFLFIFCIWLGIIFSTIFIFILTQLFIISKKKCWYKKWKRRSVDAPSRDVPSLSVFLLKSRQRMPRRHAVTSWRRAMTFSRESAN